MAVNIRRRNFLKLLDYSPEEIRYLLDLSKNFKNMKRAGIPHKYLEGKNIHDWQQGCPQCALGPCAMRGF